MMQLFIDIIYSLHVIYTFRCYVNIVQQENKCGAEERAHYLPLAISVNQ